jgi:ribonuclease T1
MRKRGLLLIIALLLVAAALFWPRAATSPGTSYGRSGPPATHAAAGVGQPDGGAVLPAFLPQQARDTIRLVARGGPFPYRQDGNVFGNRESRLPRKPRGYYREYTVVTPGLSHRGGRRIVTGGQPPEVWYYSDDHYDSFRGFDPGGYGSRR